MLSSAVALERIGGLDRLVCRQQVEQDGEVVAGASSEHEQVPDHVTVGQPLPAIENDATRIEQTTSGQEGQCFVRHLQPQLAPSHYDEPAHGEVQDDRRLTEPTDKQALEQDAQNR